MRYCVETLAYVQPGAALTPVRHLPVSQPQQCTTNAVNGEMQHPSNNQGNICEADLSAPPGFSRQGTERGAAG